MINDNSYTNLPAERSPYEPELHSKENALRLFHEMAEHVPAYKNFLQKNSVRHEDIKTYEDFVAHVPITDKINYMTQYPLADLCMDGDIFNNNIISVSSGSTGVPFFWPRGAQQEADNSEEIARIYDGFGMNEKKTLLVLCFSMGTWIAGTLFVTASINYANNKNPVSILTPGVEKKNAIDVIKRLGDSYEQIVLGGYPPFLKDIIEDGTREGIDWKKIPTKLVMGGEAFSEEWRDYALELVGAKDANHDAVNLYGVADVGVVGHETPLVVLLRRIYNKNPSALKETFGTEILPSMAQFDPKKRFIEKVGDELIVTSNSGVPLMRYNLKDTGGVVSLEDMITPVKDEFEAEAAAVDIDIKQWDMPVVFLNGRKDFTVTIYGVNIYPENIKAGLIDKRTRAIATGKFTMATTNDDNMDQTFSINVELAKGVEATAENQTLVEATVNEKLILQNSEFRKLHEVVGERAKPHVRLVEFGNQEYFARGVKHKWTKKEA
jgi:phenylacetate-CoA ligase